MRHCWNKHARARPSFQYIVNFLDTFQQGYLRRRTQSTTLALSTLEASVGEYLGSIAVDPLDRLVPMSTTPFDAPQIVIEGAEDSERVFQAALSQHSSDAIASPFERQLQ